MNHEEDDVHELLRVAVCDVRRPAGASAVELIVRARRGRRTRRAVGSAAALAVAAAVLCAVTLAQSDLRAPGAVQAAGRPGAATGGTSAFTGNGTTAPGPDWVASVPVAERKPAPDLTGEDLAGKSISLAQYRGKVVVLTVWGSWCTPCASQADTLESVAASTSAQGVQFLGIDTRDTRLASAREFASAHGLTFPSFYDPSGALPLEFPAGTLPPQTVPSTLIIDRQGRIAVDAQAQSVPWSSSVLTRVLALVLAEKH